MLSFLQYLEEASKYRFTDENSSSDTIKRYLAHPHQDAREMAVRDIHPDRHEDHAELLDLASKDKNSWVRRSVASHPHASDELLNHLAANDPNPKVKANALASLEKRKGGVVEKPKKVAKPKAEKPAAELKPVAPPKAETPKPTKPQKSSGELKIVKGDPSDHPYAKEVHHVVDSKGRKLGTVIHSSIPQEIGEDKENITSYTGDQDRTGLELHQKGHKSIPHALLSLVNHLKGKKS